MFPDFSDFLELLRTKHGKQCDCDDCKVDRGEAHWEVCREMAPNEQEEWDSIRANAEAVRHDLKRLLCRQETIEARRKLFWNKIESEFDGYDDQMAIRDNLIKRLVEVKNG